MITTQLCFFGSNATAENLGNYPISAQHHTTLPRSILANIGAKEKARSKNGFDGSETFFKLVHFNEITLSTH
jgi:hypothetical protein